MSVLSQADRQKVFEQFGCYVKEICDACGRPIGAASWTIHNDPRAWCSAKCREPQLPPDCREKIAKKKPLDQVQVTYMAVGKTCLNCGTPLNGKRAGSDFCNDTCRKRFHKKNPPKS